MGRLGDHLIDYQTNNGGTSAHPNVNTQCAHLNGTKYECHRGYCCEEMCCLYYYELWWFWFIWVLAILLSFCCAYHHKRKNRQTSFRTSPLYDNHDIYSGACNYPGPPLDNKSEMMGYTKLPIYDDVIRIPPTASPPPPYSSRRQPVNTVAYVQRDENGPSLQIVECNITSSMLSLASLSHYIPDILTRGGINFQSAGSCNNNGVNSSTPNSQTDAIIVSSEVGSQQEESLVIESESAAEKPQQVVTVTTTVDEDDESTPSSSRNSVMTNNSEDLPPRVIVRSITDLHSDEDYDSDSDAEDDWMLNGNVDPNNNNVVVDIEKLCSKDDKEEQVSLTSPKNQDVSPMASIQDLIEDPQAY